MDLDTDAYIEKSASKLRFKTKKDDPSYDVDKQKIVYR
jgi:hypothetical protein